MRGWDGLGLDELELRELAADALEPVASRAALPEEQRSKLEAPEEGRGDSAGTRFGIASKCLASDPRPPRSVSEGFQGRAQCPFAEAES
mmetsp:Transcript_13322/g.26784  ORF Transcript_13322/g.26784 Transcript_13322/m.26784 type:complete len:89 (+) Transcript_13322:1334-1600(+)